MNANHQNFEMQGVYTMICSEKTIQITADICEAVNFAMQQNHVPIVRQIKINNNSDNDIEHIKLSITTDPDVADEWSIRISSIPAGQEYKLDKINLHLSATRLFELTERVNGSVIVQISDESGVLVQEKYGIAFLSHDEWSGAYTYPEFLAAFVTPNHPYIFEILKKSEVLLTEWTGSPSFTGYQSNNHNNVLKQMAAIYGALQQENITYCAPPASFEKDGQKIRLCSAIREQKLGTCLDLSLLYASCLEAIGLNPMIIVVKGHAFVACWLENESFAECIQDDISVVTKRIAPGVNEICVVESTAFVKGKNENFESAVLMAENHLKNADDFLYLVGIKRSRGSGIKPIPQKKEDGSWDYGEGADIKSSVTDKPDEIEVMGKLNYVDSIEYTKQQMWERKLLDLSMRNALLNFRVTKNSIQLFVDSLHELEDALIDGKEFQIFHRPNDMIDSPRDNKIYEALNKESSWVTLIKSEFKNHRIRTFLDEVTLGKQIQTLYRTAKTSMEENGANTMYLALGFLKWYETNISEKPRYAPLVLLPIDIIRKSAQRGYVFRLRDEEPQFNVTLLEMLRRDFGIAATGLDPLPYDEKGVDVKRIFHVVRQLIMNQPRWDVEELAFIGVFSFTQFIMWNDIRHRGDDLRRNKIVSSLMSGQMNWTADAIFPLPDELDDSISPVDMAVPISADSSQLAAIYTAGKAQSFVLHGPPGTGKSQTITNIIANALYQGKSVLFVAEKMAALEVVEKRLEAIGIGDFCLELHSNKARKKDVLEQLEKALNIGKIKSPDSFYDEANEIFELRKELNEVVRELHKPRHFGFSLYDAISKVSQHCNAPDCFNFPLDWVNELTAQKFSRCIDLCRLLAVAAKDCNSVHNHVLKEYTNKQYSHGIKSEFEANLRNYKNLVAEFKVTSEKIYAELKIHNPKLNEQQYLEKINSICAAVKRRNEVKTGLSSSFAEGLLSISAETVYLQWEQAETSWFIPKRLVQSKVAKLIKLYSSDKKSFDKTQIPKLLKDVIEFQKNDSLIAENVDFPLISDIVGNMSKLEEVMSTNFILPLGVWRHEVNGFLEITEKVDRWLANAGSLRDYSAYLQVKSEATDEGMGFVCDALENGLLTESELESAFIKGASKLCIYFVVDNTLYLSQFRGNLFAHKIEKFKELCNQYQLLTRQELASRLSAQIPALSAGVSSSSEVGILQRAIKSGGRMMPVRKLFENIPTLLRKLCPCILMSPISVAQYLDPKYPPFDLVIFDEASQMPTNEAVGAIARGKELIVVGDPKQLPPTSFFSSNNIDEANYDKEDLESVLDDCLAISMPQEHLLWHYRSRHESLIAFSNQMYYDNKLYTFPSPNDMVSQVRLVPIDGFYDKGKTKQNRAEAEAIVKEIIRRLSDPILQKRSIGVVTFNSTQQNLIIDMLEEEFAKNPEIDELANNAEEPVFVKNLKNVQGDERDVIFFSIGYGPDSQGRVTLNFGPLNREGGWRRLNVAVSRARYEMLVYSVLKPEQIDLNRTRAEGLAGLKAFLEFAARGSIELISATNTKGETDSHVSAIADGIRSLGFDVKVGIGVSGYQVDIGVVHPKNPDEYILGVLCDGKNYFKGGTALDRNQTQESVLRHLGWRTTRAWALDWLESPEKELERIKADIEDALKQYKLPVVDEAPKVKNVFEIEQTFVELNQYSVVEIPPANFHGENVETFLGSSSSSYIRSQIETILNAEAPISSDVLCKRILDSWGIARRGNRINERFDRIFTNMGLPKTVYGDAIFYWNYDADPKSYDEFRVPSEDAKTRRNIEHIAPEEMASAIKHIIGLQIGLGAEDLCREISKIFGFARCTESMVKTMRVGIDLAAIKSWIIVTGNKISISREM